MQFATALTAWRGLETRVSPRQHIWRSIVLLLFVAASAAAQTVPAVSWVTIGPEGGDVHSVAFDPHDSSRVFLGTSAGDLYVSTDGAASWSHSAHLGDDYVLNQVIIDPAHSKTVYAIASAENNAGDVFRSRDRGRTWQALPGMHGKAVRSFVLYGRNSRTLLAGASDGLFRSSDGGDTWERISPADNPELRNISSVAIDPTNPDIIYAGSSHLPWKTIDGGRTWQPMKHGIAGDAEVSSIIIDQHTPSTLYLSAGSFIYKSENSGDLFRKLPMIPSAARRTRTLRQDPVNPAIVYAATTEGLWKTIDGGNAWRRTTAATLIVNDVSVDPQRPARVLLATQSAGVLASEDGGQTVRAFNHGFSHRQFSAVVADRTRPETLYAAIMNDKEFGGVLITRDAGAHWQTINKGLIGGDIYSLAQTSTGDLLAGTERGVYIYDHRMDRWRPINLIINENIISVPVRWTRTRNARLKNASATRREYVRGQLKGRVSRVAVFGERWYAATPDGIYASYDHGGTWHGGPVEDLHNFMSLAADGEILVACTPDALAISRNHGIAWRTVPLPSDISAAHGVALAFGAIWITARDGVFTSRDNAANWQPVLAGAPQQTLTSLRYDASAQRLLAVTESGEIYSTSDGQNWARTASAGVSIRSLTIASGRFLAITASRGLVAEPDSTAARGARSGK